MKRVTFKKANNNSNKNLKDFRQNNIKNNKRTDSSSPILPGKKNSTITVGNYQ